MNPHTFNLNPQLEPSGLQLKPSILHPQTVPSVNVQLEPSNLQLEPVLYTCHARDNLGLAIPGVGAPTRRRLQTNGYIQMQILETYAWYRASC